MDTLHTASDDRPTVTLLLDIAEDLRLAGELEDDRPAHEDITDDEADARADRNEKLIEAYEGLFLTALTAEATDRDITVQVTHDFPTYHQATVDGDRGELAQDVYQAAHDRITMAAARTAAGLPAPAAR